jgi:hypothetical protein
VKGWPDLAAALTEDSASDGAAIERLLAKQHLSFPHKTVLVRMFHLPSADHQTGLMIMYGGALPQYTAVSVCKGGVQLHMESPGSAQMFPEKISVSRSPQVPQSCSIPVATTTVSAAWPSGWLVRDRNPMEVADDLGHRFRRLLPYGRTTAASCAFRKNTTPVSHRAHRCAESASFMRGGDTYRPIIAGTWRRQRLPRARGCR